MRIFCLYLCVKCTLIEVLYTPAEILRLWVTVKPPFAYAQTTILFNVIFSICVFSFVSNVNRLSG